MKQIQPSRYLPFLFGCLMLAIASILFAQPQELNDEMSKQVKQNFAVQPDATLFLNNEFGSIVCKSWDKQEVLIEVNITVHQMSSEKAISILENIAINFQEDPASLKVKTTIPQNLKVKGQFAVDYIVRMPSTLKLNLENKLGDVQIDERNAKTQIRVDYGNAIIGHLNHGDNMVDIRFGAAKIESMKGAVMLVHFSRVGIGYAGSIKLQSEYTELTIGRVVVLDGNYEGGLLHVGTASVCKLKTTYADIQIDSLKQKLELTGEFGNVEVGYVDPAFQYIVLVDAFGSYTVHMGHISGFHIDAISDLGVIKLPGKKQDLAKYSVNGKQTIYQGIVGQNPTGFVKIRSENGSVDLR